MYKQVIVLRTDLDLPLGKASAQVAHASVEAAVQSDDVAAWRRSGQKKVVVAGRDEDHLYQLHNTAEELDVPAAIIHDAGKTVTDAGTATALGIGPDREENIDKVTGGLETL